MANVKFKRKDFIKIAKLYKLIRDCIGGAPEVKAAKTTYLPQPNAADTSDANIERYDAYINRAVFYGVTGRTLAGLVGQVFSRDPVIEVPEGLKLVTEDANGEEVDIIQLSKKATSLTLGYGRAGLFTDYPSTEGTSISKADLETGKIRPTISLYRPEQVINWRTKTRGAETILSLIVLEEKYVSQDDGFEMKEALQYRVLRLGPSTENVTFEASEIYTVEIWRGDVGNMGITETYQPKNHAGNYFDELPFSFIGSENNDSEIDHPPLYDIASLNIAHYRNSADYEESCYIVGQPTPYLTGLTEEWVTSVLKGTVTLGSRAAIALPKDASAGLLQADPNSMPKEAMELKERQMVALGAKLVEQTTVQRTATEAGIEEASETSILSSSAKNVSKAFVKAFEWCAAFTGDTGPITFELNSDFDISGMGAQERAQIIAEWQSGAITFNEMRETLRKAGIATLEDADAKELIAKELGDTPNLDDGE